MCPAYKEGSKGNVVSFRNVGINYIMSFKDILQIVMGFIIVAGLVYYVVKHTGFVEGLEDKKTGTSETKTASLPKERKVLNM
jgi:large-conductance mechanosensitive channel